LFLFFGWFKRTERGTDGKLRYVRGEGGGIHSIYGYLQVGSVVTDEAEIKTYQWHPHASMAKTKNCLYIARDTLSWDSTRSGYGVFQYDDRLVLTKADIQRYGYAQNIRLTRRRLAQRPTARQGIINTLYRPLSRLHFH
jgi:hypothetical protein